MTGILFRPNSEEEFMDAKRSGVVGLRVQCFVCHEHFSGDNVFSREGWRETQISTMCEKCFDTILEEYDE